MSKDDWMKSWTKRTKRKKNPTDCNGVFFLVCLPFFFVTFQVICLSLRYFSLVSWHKSGQEMSPHENTSNMSIKHKRHQSETATTKNTLARVAGGVDDGNGNATLSWSTVRSFVMFPQPSSLLFCHFMICTLLCHYGNSFSGAIYNLFIVSSHNVLVFVNVHLFYALELTISSIWKSLIIISLPVNCQL